MHHDFAERLGDGGSLDAGHKLHRHIKGVAAANYDPSLSPGPKWLIGTRVRRLPIGQAKAVKLGVLDVEMFASRRLRSSAQVCKLWRIALKREIRTRETREPDEGIDLPIISSRKVHIKNRIISASSYRQFLFPGSCAWNTILAEQDWLKRLHI